MKRNLLVFMTIVSNICNAQSSFYAGVNGSINVTTLLNKEDKNAPAGMLDKKNGIQAGYGMQIGYNIKNRIRMSVEPNYLQYKISYSGKSDTASVRSFDANVRFRYYQIPLVLNYYYPVTERIAMFGAIGLSFNYMGYYKEEFDGEQVPLGFPPSAQGDRINYYYSGKKGYAESAELNNKWDMEISHSKYITKSYSLILRAGSEYSLTDKFGLYIQVNYQRGISDMEYKGIGTEKTTDMNNNTYTNTFNYWNETNYMRYYYRYPDKYNQRKATHTMAMGLGIGINYYFNGGLLPSIHNNK